MIFLILKQILGFSFALFFYVKYLDSSFEKNMIFGYLLRHKTFNLV